jgi:hypothetical protein
MNGQIPKYDLAAKRLCELDRGLAIALRDAARTYVKGRRINAKTLRLVYLAQALSGALELSSPAPTEQPRARRRRAAEAPASSTATG